MFEEENNDDDDEIAIIEPENLNTLNNPTGTQISIENDHSNTIETVYSDNTKNDSNSNGNRPKSERVPSSSSSSSSCTISSSSIQSTNGSCVLDKTKLIDIHPLILITHFCFCLKIID